MVHLDRNTDGVQYNNLGSSNLINSVTTHHFAILISFEINFQILLAECMNWGDLALEGMIHRIVV